MTDAERNIWYNGKQTLSCTLTSGNNVININNSDIAQGGFTITRSCASGDKIAFGECVAATLEMTLINNDGKFDNFDFAGASVVPVVTATYNGQTANAINLGYFIVDAVPVYGKRIQLTAYDISVQYDGNNDIDTAKALVVGFNLANALDRVLGGNLANVDDVLANFPNATKKITAIDEGQNELSARNLARWICEYMGCYLYTNSNGKFVARRYILSTNNATAITKNNRYDCDVRAVTVKIKGVRIVRGNETPVRYGEIAGTDDYTIDIVDNPLTVNETDTNILTNIFSGYMTGSTSQFVYMPFNATVFPMVWLQPGSTLTVTDGYTGDVYTSFATNITYGLNCTMALSCVGKSVREEGYASQSVFTTTQLAYLQRYINQVRKMLGLTDSEELNTAVEQSVSTATSGLQTGITNANNYITLRAKDLETLNNAICRGLGFYSTTVTVDGGEPDKDKALVYYWHNNPTLAASTTVYKFNSGGVAWTNEYAGEQTVWKSGISSEGDAVFRNLSVLGLTANAIKTGTLSSTDGTSVVFNLDNGTLTMNKGEINLGTGDAQTHITSTLAQIGNPLYLHSDFHNRTINSLAISSDIDADGNSIPAVALGLGAEYGGDGTEYCKTVYVGNFDKSDVTVKSAYSGTTETNNLKVNGNVTGTLKFATGKSLRCSNTGVSVKVNSANCNLATQFHSNDVYALGIGGSVPTLIVSAAATPVYIGNAITDANKLTDWVYEQGTTTAGGLTWYYRKWHSGLAECFCNAQTVTVSWTSAFTKTQLLRGTATVTMPFIFKPCYNSQMSTCDNKYLLGRSYCTGSASSGSSTLNISVWGTADEGTGNPKVNLYAIGMI